MKNRWSKQDRQRFADGDRLKAQAISGKRKPAPEVEEWAEEVTLPRKQRRRLVNPECRTCLEHGGGLGCPPHDASPHCQSGSYPHCTCDRCF